MTNTIGGATIELGVDSSGVESGLDRVDGAVRRTGRTLDSLRTQGGGALDSIGAGGSAAANRVDAATRNIAGAVERTNAALIAGKKSSSEYFEELGRSRGADMMKLAPLIAQLRETEAAQARAKSATEAAAAAQQAAAEAARAQASALRDVASAQAGRDSYVASLREQIALYGKSTEEVLRYKAAQAGAAEAAGPLILQLQNMRAAHEAIAESTRLEAQAQRQVAQAQANKDGYLSALREQVALHGKSAEEVMRYRAALAGAAAEAEPLIQQIERLKVAENAVAEAARNAERSLRQATQVQANGDAFLAGLREQVALYGKTTEEVMRYKAAQAGVASAAEPQIQKLQQLKIAQEAVTEAARLAAAAQQQAAQVQSNRDTLLAGLREQIALYGKSTEEVLRYRASQAGAVGAAEPLIQELQRLKIAQDSVTEAARLAAAAQQQAAQQQAAGTTMVASLREQIALYGKTTEEVLRYKAAQAGVAGAAEPHIQELQRLKLAEEAVTTAARAAAEAQRQAAAAQTGRDSFVTGLQQQAAAIGKSRTDLLELQAAQMGVTAQAAPFIAKLREVEQGLNHAGMSARATAAAMRGVPAQFTDIITSIQGGQAPLTVLLQQGGQLKDMFGGLGNAAKALGGYILGLVNPYTIVGATAAVLAVAFVQGRNESIAYSKALITTGNAAGTTAGQLSDMARAIGATLGTQGAAAEAVAALAGTGKVAAANIQEFGLVAIQVQRALGKSVQDTVADFADLGKAPSATLLKLNEQFHFLTGEVYSQVKALEMQGRTIEAATAAQLAYSSAASSVSSKVADNLGTLQKAWKGITDIAKGAWDAMLNVGREDSLEDKLAKVQAAIAKASKPFDPSVGGNSESRGQLAGNVVLERLLRGQIKLKNDEAVAEREANKLREAGLAWDQEKEKYLTRVQLREQEITKARNQAAAAGVSQADTDTRLAAIKLKYADTYNLAIDAQIELLKRRGVVEEESAKRSMAALGADRAAGLATSLLAEFNYADAVAKLDQDALARKRALLVAELALTAAKPNSKKEQAGLSGAIAEVDAQALTRTLQLKNDIATLDIKDTKQALANIADLAAARATDLQALQSQLQAQKDANALIGLSAAEVNNFNQALTEEAAKRLENQAALIGGNDARAAEAATMRASAVVMRELAAEQAKGASLTAGTDVAKAKELLDILVAVDNAAKQAAQGMTESFGRVGSAIGGLTTALSGYAVQQQAIAAQLAAVRADPKSSADKIAQAELAATKASATAKVKSYADMASAAKGFFNENSKGYKALETTEKAFRAYEMAMAVESMVKKIFFKETEVAANVALNATKLTGEAATTAASTGLAATEASAWGITAVVKALASLPFPLNLAAGAATLAAVVAIGAQMMGGIGGGGADVSKQRQETQGTGSVFGDKSAKSDSIAKSIELAATNSSIELTHTAGMLASLKAIETSISGLGNLLVRGTDVTSLAGNVAATSSGGFFGNIMSSIFGGKTTVQDTGVMIGKGSIADIAAGGVNSQSYVDTKKSGGWFSSSKYNTATKDLGAEVDDQFAKVILSLSASVKTAADLLGVGGDAFTAKLNSFVVDIGKISLKDMTGEQIQEALETVFSKVGDDMAQFGVAGLEQFQQVGEGYFETLTRVATNYANLNSIMESIGTSFGATGMSSIAARENLIALAGGIDELAGQTSSFASNFLSQAEQLAPVQKYVTDQLAAMGLQSLDTRDKFKDYVLGLANSGALATDAGAKQYTSLLALADAFAKTHAATEDLTRSEQDIADERTDLRNQLDELTMTQAQLAEKARAAIAPYNLALYDQVIAAQAAKDAADALSTANQGYQQQIDQLLAARQGEAALRALEIVGMDATTIALRDRLVALKAEDAAATSLANANAGYQKQIDQLVAASQGAAAVRALEIKGMDASTIALYDRLAGLKAATEAEKIAADAIKKAQETAAAAVQSFGNALVDSITRAKDAAAAFRALNDSLLLSDSSTLNPEQKYLEAQRQFLTADPEHLQAAEKAFLDASKAWFGGSAGFAADFAAVIARNNAEAMSNDDLSASIPAVWQKYLDSLKGVDGSHANGLDFVPFDGYRAELHRGERVQTAAAVRDGDSASARTNELLQEVLTELRADKTQRGAVGNATLARLETVVRKLDDNKRATRAAAAKEPA